MYELGHDEHAGNEPAYRVFAEGEPVAAPAEFHVDGVPARRVAVGVDDAGNRVYETRAVVITPESVREGA